jgi:hypothetical protein
MKATPARLDSDGTAKPLTEIVIHYPNDGKCRGPVPADDAQLVYRPTFPGTELEVRKGVRDQYIRRLEQDRDMYLAQAKRSVGLMKDRSEDMADECSRIAGLIASEFGG